MNGVPNGEVRREGERWWRDGGAGGVLVLGVRGGEGCGCGGL